LFTSVLPASVDDTIRARVVFVGDIMVHKQQLEAARNGASWDFKQQFRMVKPLFRRSLTVGNLETLFAGEKKKFSGYPTFNTPDELAAALAYLEIDVAMLANNHILDHGLDAALRTTKVLDDAGIFWTGLSFQDDLDAPLIIEHSGLKWAFINYSYGSNITRHLIKSEDQRLNIISGDAIVSALKRALTYEPDITIAFFHWGLEYQHSPSTSQRNTAALCIKNGADLVIGSHPHVLQPIEVVSSDRGYAIVAYSLGNFISFQRTEPRERGVVLAVDVEKKPGERAVVSRVSIAPTWVSARKEGGRRKIEVVYAGNNGQFGHTTLPIDELKRAQAAGRAVSDFLGAVSSVDSEGFYTLWDRAAPNVIPHSRRKSPR
jgi:poly-gamma-glutamate synthesis protein (capsule biosynthesis protein)